MSVSNVGVVWRGLLMGVVEVLPGVSGGTIALVTGIYDRMVNAMSRAGSVVAGVGDRASLFDALKFLAALAVSMVVGALVAANFVIEIVEREPVFFWATILGVIVAVLIYLISQVERKFLAVYAPIGLIFGLPLALLAYDGEPSIWLYFVGGFSAFCAWVLPGISGSMLLLSIGLWIPVLEAVVAIDVLKLALFVIGVATAFVILPRMIANLLDHMKQPILGFFAGLVASTLYRAWPWRGIENEPVLPALGADENNLFTAISCFLLGGVLISLLMYLAKRDAT